MSDDHKMTKKDKMWLGFSLAAIFGGVFGIGLLGIILFLNS
jgi:hypothetical protein